MHHVEHVSRGGRILTSTTFNDGAHQPHPERHVLGPDRQTFERQAGRRICAIPRLKTGTSGHGTLSRLCPRSGPCQLCFEDRNEPVVVRELS